MDIAVRLEGGIGDHLLANRFVHALKEKYPNDNFIIFSDPSQDFGQLLFLKEFWPSVYKNAILSPGRVSSQFKIRSQFGEEVYNAAIENQPDSIKYLCERADKFYDLCLDRMEWLDYDFDWFRYFYFFPKPEKQPVSDNPINKPFILASLFSRQGSPYTMEKEYVQELFKGMSALSHVVIVTTEENKSYYDFCVDNPAIEVRVTNLSETFYLASQCSAFIGMDSGVRCMPYYFGKPTFYFTPYCSEYGTSSVAHLVRWMVYERNSLPMHFNLAKTLELLSNSISERNFPLFPFVPPQHRDNILLKRIYKVPPLNSL